MKASTCDMKFLCSIVVLLVLMLPTVQYCTRSACIWLLVQYPLLFYGTTYYLFQYIYLCRILDLLYYNQEYWSCVFLTVLAIHIEWTLVQHIILKIPSGCVYLYLPFRQQEIIACICRKNFSISTTLYAFAVHVSFLILNTIYIETHSFSILGELF